MALTLKEATLFIEKIRQVFDVAIINQAAADRVVSQAKISVEWEAATKEELTKAGLPHSTDQIPLLRSMLCQNYTAPFPADFFILKEVSTLRPEYLAGTWFNRQDRSFKLNIEFDWVNRMYGTQCGLPLTPMSISFYASTGDHIWDFISEVHVHPTAVKEFPRPRNGWIEAPGHYIWKYLAAESPLNFIDRMMKVPGGRTIVQLRSGMGGWATFEQVRNSDVTAAAAGLLFKFSDPLYCARSDGKVVIKFKDVASRATLTDMSNFPSGRTLVTDRNKFPSCIPPP